MRVPLGPIRFVYDNGDASGPGVLTSSGNGSWNGGADAFCRLATATNNIIPYAAFGHVNGQSTLSAWLDNQLFRNPRRLDWSSWLSA
jgi:hypothetical protein